MPGSTWKFDEIHWLRVIRSPDWYMEFVPYAKRIHQSLEEGSEDFDQFNKTVRHFFEKALINDQVALANQGPNLDEQRQPVDTIVIHHTSNKPGYRLTYLNAVHLLTIYAPYFTDPTDERERSLKGQPIWSGHLARGKPVFWGYHWFMRMDGSFEHLLEDNQIGWHAGNWEVNKRSVGICLDNDYEKMCPTNNLLERLAEHIKKNYPGVKKVIGHCEARKGTICPGTHFLAEWKPSLLNYLAD